MIKEELGRIILGHLPFIGISYKGEKKDREYARKFSNASEVKKIIEVALRYGVKCLSSPSPDFNELSPAFMETLKSIGKTRKLGVIPCTSIPLLLDNEKVNEFRRWKTVLIREKELFGENVERKILLDPLLNLRENWEENLKKSPPYSAEEINKLNLDIDHLRKTLKVFKELNANYVVLGSESDFLAAVDRLDLIERAIKAVTKEGFKGVILASHHAGLTIPLTMELNIGGFVTPVNKLGIMMFPGKESVEEKMRQMDKALIAIKPLGGGRIHPAEAFKYVYSEVKVDSCMIGLASVKEAHVDLSIALKWASLSEK